MEDGPVDLDSHRGMAAQKATELRRFLADVELNKEILRAREREFEGKLLTVQAQSWADAAAKARYLLGMYAESLSKQDSHHKDLVAAVLADFDRLESEP